MEEEQEYLIPLFLINGQLESGKTTFISDLISVGQFDEAQKKLLIVCEEGEVEYDTDMLKEHEFDIVYLEKEEWTKEKLEELNEKYEPWLVVVEYNGMWEVETIAKTAMPNGWAVYQAITIINAQTFGLQWKNMQSIMADTVKSAESIIFNRSNEEMDLASYRRSMKALNEGVEIIFEDESGQIMTGINSILPYDMNEEIINVEDCDFGIWFIDAREREEEYRDKVFRFKAQVLKAPQMAANEFVSTRRAMTCCEDDIALIGYLSVYEKAKELEDQDWIIVTAKVKYEAKKEYNDEKGPVLYVSKVEKAEAPKVEVVSF